MLSPESADPGSSPPERFVVEVFSELRPETIQRRWEDVNVILRMSMLTGLQMQLEATLNLLCDMAAEVTAFDKAIFYFWDESQEVMQPRLTRNVEKTVGEEVASGNILNFWSLKYGRPLLVERGHNIQSDALLQVMGAGSALAVPLFVSNRVMGSMQFFLTAENAFQKEDAQLLWILSLVAENLLTREYANEGLLRFAFTDYLTGLRTRGYFEQQLELEFKRAERKQQKFALLMIDIDHFKILNDTFGHHVGDQLLRDVTSILMKDMREVDTVARYGGEEFVIILPETTETGAMFVAQRLRRAVDQAKFFAGSPHSVQHLTISIGIAILAIAVLSLPVFMGGQAISGDLLGVVTDSSGAVVPNAQVVATNLATGAKSTLTTNASGEYHFVNLPVGHYSLDMTAANLAGGYKDVQVSLNKQSTYNITASVTGKQETLEVTADALTIDTSTHNIQNTFETKEVQDLPTASIGLGVLNLSLLNAGVATSGGIGVGTGPSISGQRPRNNNFTIEGVDNNSKGVTGPLLTIPNDAVQNFTVLQNQFSPEFGHSSGGQFNQTVVSGSNGWHGRIYEYLQNRNLNAIDDTQIRVGSTVPGFDNNRFGGQVGGPIWKDKVFFFTNQEYNPVHQTLGSNFVCSPTAAGYAALAALPGANTNNIAILQKFMGTASQAATLNDGSNCGDEGALTTGGLNGAGATVPVGDVVFGASAFNNTYTTVNSFDVNLSDKDQIRLRYIYQKNDATDASANIPTFFTTVPTRDHLIALSEYHTFTPTLTNEFRLGFNRNTSTLGAGNFAFPGLDSFPNLIFFDIGNQVGPDGNAPQFTIQNFYSATDNISWIKGKHTFKFGIEGRKYISPQGFTQRARGDYEYNNLEDYVTDEVPTNFGQRSTGSNTYYGDQSSIYVYGNDEFRVTKNLTLNLGLRYEFTSVPTGMRQQALNSAASVPGLLVFGAPQPQYGNFAPRIGFAYSPRGSSDTVVRGGFGMATDVIYDNLGLLAVPPQFGGTCDVNQSVNGAGGCVWSTTGFLAGGGLPAGQGSGLKTFASLADQRAASVNFLPSTLKLPYSESWNLGIEHVFAKKYTAEVRYVGTKGIHLPVQQQLNVQPKVSSSLFLPTFLNQPDAATIAGLTTTLAQINAQPRIIPAFTQAGFVNGITSFQPYGQSIYNGLQTQVTRTYSNGLQLLAAYTWSHTFDNSTADVFSTQLTPRRPQNSQDFAADYSTSALDRRQRLSLEAIYNVPFFKGSSNWMAKNLLGNWEVAPQWQLQSPEFYTPQSGTDSNLNGDAAPDRTIINPSGTPGTGTAVTAVKNLAGDTVGYVANNPNAQYIQAGPGALATAPRNTLATPRTNNWDMTVVKRFNVTEHSSLEFQAQAFNIFNHPQFVPGSVNTVNSIGFTSIANFVDVNHPTSFNDPTQFFSNNPRILQLVGKFIF